MRQSKPLLYNMTKALALLISVGFLISGCDNPKTPQDVTDPNNATHNKADIGKLNDALKKYEEPAQVFKVAASKPSIITGRKGTKIRINPADLVTESGKPLGQTINVELKELTNQGQLLRTNAQTVSDGKLLVSGGAYFINLTSDGEQLKLQAGKNLAVRFPKLSDKEMALFYGQKNDLGQLNWQKAPGIFKATRQLQPAADTAIHRNTKHANSNKADIDAIFEYIERGDTTMTPEERAKVAKLEQERGEMHQ